MITFFEETGTLDTRETLREEHFTGHRFNHVASPSVATLTTARSRAMSARRSIAREESRQEESMTFLERLLGHGTRPHRFGARDALSERSRRMKPVENTR